MLTVLRRPALAQHVERLLLEETGEFFNGDGAFFYNYEKDKYKLKLEDTPIEAAIRGLDIDFADEWIERLHHEWVRVRWDGLLALYLAFFPALKEVQFC
jgi:hypothetical protein